MPLTKNRTRARSVLAALAAVAAVGAGAAGCGGGAGASPGSGSGSSPGSGAAGAASPAQGSSATAHQTARGQMVTITGNSALRFMPMTIHVHTGRLRIVLKDSGAYPHNIVIPRLGRTSATVTGSPGETQKVFIVNFPRPGRYAFRCQYHASAGMTGVFVVS
jgi:plastocyanin